MRIRTVLMRAPTLLGVAFALGCAAITAHVGNPKVHVDWSDPGQFSDVRESMCRTAVKPQEWIGNLADYLKRRASNVIAPNHELDITITDVMRAGVCEPWRGPRWDDIRVVKNIYPPRIDLRYVLKNTDGTTLREGEAKLRDLGFLNRGTPDSNDTLRYEKRMLDDWLNREFTR